MKSGRGRSQDSAQEITQIDASKVSEEIDISEYPTAIEASPSSQVTIGDLHGNALKFIYFLIKEGVLQLSEADYLEFVKIYRESTINKLSALQFDARSPPLTKANFERFNQIIENAQVNRIVINNEDVVVRLIGDELADRGANDYFTLKILEKLKNNKVTVEALFSNHGVEFVEAMESETFLEFNAGGMDGAGQVNSLVALQQLVDDGLITEAEVKKIYKESYQPFFKAISYTIKDDEITLYTHAPVGLEVIRKVAEKLNVKYDDSSIDKLASTIDEINNKFHEKVVSGEVKNLYRQDSKDNHTIQPQEEPFALLMWHRDRNKQFNVDRPKSKTSLARKILGGKPSYKLHFVHGHDGDPGVKDNVINLNNDTGKFESTEGKYAVVKVQGRTKKLVLKKQEEVEEAKIDINNPGKDSSDIYKGLAVFPEEDKLPEPATSLIRKVESGYIFKIPTEGNNCPVYCVAQFLINELVSKEEVNSLFKGHARELAIQKMADLVNKHYKTNFDTSGLISQLKVFCNQDHHPMIPLHFLSDALLTHLDSDKDRVKRRDDSGLEAEDRGLLTDIVFEIFGKEFEFETQIYANIEGKELDESGMQLADGAGDIELGLSPGYSLSSSKRVLPIYYLGEPGENKHLHFNLIGNSSDDISVSTFNSALYDNAGTNLHDIPEVSSARSIYFLEKIEGKWKEESEQKEGAIDEYLSDGYFDQEGLEWRTDEDSEGNNNFFSSNDSGPLIPRIEIHSDSVSSTRSQILTLKQTTSTEWIDVDDRNMTYCILKTQKQAELSEKIIELQKMLDQENVAVLSAKNVKSPPWELRDGETRLSLHQLYTDGTCSSKISQYGLVETKSSPGTITSTLHLSKTVCLTEDAIDKNEFTLLLTIIDQQVQQGITACGGKAVSKVTLALSINDPAKLSIYEQAYLFYCKEKGYGCNCFDNGNQLIDRSKCILSDKLKGFGITKDSIEAASQLQAEFTNSIQTDSSVDPPVESPRL